MIAHDFDRLLATWLTEDAGAGAPDYLDETLEGIAGVRQRPAWMSPGRWLPMQLAMRRVYIPRPALYLALVAILAIALLAAVIFVGSQQRRLPPPFGIAATGLMAFDHDGDIYIANRDGTAKRPLRAGSGSNSSPAFSLDGTRLAYWSEVGAQTAAADTSLWVMNAAGGDARNLTAGLQLDPAEILFPAAAWSPNGHTIAFAARTNAADAAGLYIVEADGTGLHRLDVGQLGVVSPTWSPNGEEIAFTGYAPGDSYLNSSADPAIYVIRKEGSALRRITRTKGNEMAFTNPQWSIDATRLLYFTGLQSAFQVNSVPGLPTRGHDIAIAQADGSGETVLTHDDADEWFPTWTPTQNAIVFRHFGYPDGDPLFQMDPDGSRVRPLGPTELVKGFATCLSPDGLLVLAFGASEAEYVAVPIGGDAVARISAPSVPLGLGACSWQRLALD